LGYLVAEDPMEDKAYLAKLLVNPVVSTGKTQTHVFVRAGTLEELKSNGRLLVHGPHRPILVIEEQDRLYALDNRCPHMGFRGLLRQRGVSSRLTGIANVPITSCGRFYRAPSNVHKE
jgi:hypothetical protein